MSAPANVSQSKGKMTGYWERDLLGGGRREVGGESGETEVMREGEGKGVSSDHSMSYTCVRLLRNLFLKNNNNNKNPSQIQTKNQTKDYLGQANGQEKALHTEAHIAHLTITTI